MSDSSLRFLPALPAFLGLSLWVAACPLALAEQGPEPPAEPSWFQLPGDDFRYLLGLSYSHGATHPGARRMAGSLQPMWAARWGKWRLSSSGGAGLLGFGVESIGPGTGASRDLLRTDKLRLGITLRLDNGRSSQADSYTEGLPDVGRTLRTRLYASYALNPRWQLSGAWNQDALGRRGGAVWALDLSRRLFRSPADELMLNFNLSAGSTTYMHSYFGVPADSPAAQRLGRSYQPGAGFEGAGLGLTYTRALSPHWVLGMGAHVGRLLGPAAASPLTEKPGSWGLGFSLGYRN